MDGLLTSKSPKSLPSVVIRPSEAALCLGLIAYKLMDLLSSNLWQHIVYFLPNNDLLTFRAVSKASTTKVDASYAACKVNLHREVEELSTTPLYSQHQEASTVRLASREDWRTDLSGITVLKLAEVKAYANPPRAVGEVLGVATFIALRRTEGPLCTWAEFKEASMSLLATLSAVEVEYLCMPSVKAVLDEYLSSEEHSPSYLGMISTAAGLICSVLAKMSRIERTDYEKRLDQLHQRLAFYSRIERVQDRSM